MPLYDFECGACGERFEALVSAGADPPCPACSAARVRRLYTPISPKLKLEVRGAAARKSNAARRVREEARKERRARRDNGG